MRPRLIAVGAALAATLTLVACGADDPPPPQGSGGRLQNADLPKGSSGTLVVARDGEMLDCRGWGLSDREEEVAAGCDTVYDVMSMTKQFTAAAILKLQMQGRLQVTDPLGRYVADVPPDKSGITLQHLLTHTAGLTDSLGGDYDPLSRSDLVAAALASELRSAPGTTYHYSNVGYSLLAVIIEEASGVGYEEYLAEELFGPAGMTSTGYVLPAWDPADVAVEYDARDRPQGRPFEHPWAEDGPYWNLRGNGGLLSTARDMYRWYVALESEQVLDAQAKRELFRPRVLEEPGGDTRYAYGWVVMETARGTVQWHNGGNGWSYGEITRVPEARAMVFWVTNQVSGRGWEFDGDDGAALTQLAVERLLDG